MMDTDRSGTSSRERASHGGIRALDVLMIFARRKALILGMATAGGILATGVAYMLPNVYQARLALLPPQRAESSTSALLSQLGGLEGVSALKSPNDLYVGILKSRTIADNLVSQFDLQNVYHTDTREATRKRLEIKSNIATSKNGLITVEVDDTDKKRAATLANAYGDELLKLTRTLAISEAAQRRLFFERQLMLAKDNLAKTEASLKGNLERHGVVSVDAESRAVVETVAQLRARASAKEIELNSMRAFVTETNPNFRRVQQELQSLRDELSKLENGRASGGGRDEPAAGKGGLANVQQMRDLKYYQMLYELLLKQYEAAHLDEAKETAVVQVLDQAVEPERPVKPKRFVLAIVGVIAGLGFGIFLALALEARKKIISKPETRARWNALKNEFLSRRGTSVE